MRSEVKCFEIWWPGTELTDIASLFRATLCCSLNDLRDSGWPPKSLRSRERHANRGLKSWVQLQVQEDKPHSSFRLPLERSHRSRSQNAESAGPGAFAFFH